MTASAAIALLASAGCGGGAAKRLASTGESVTSTIAKRMHIEAAGVGETRFPEPESAYGFRYDGLKLLFHSGGRYFIIPASWTPSGGTTIVLRDDDSLRPEFVHSE
ncbi:MAG: hypothetical protein V7605_849 [Acidimicrobiaceae bacterium]